MTPARAIAFLLLVLVLYFVALEAAMVLLIPRISVSAKREQQDLAAVRALSASPATTNERVLFVGNSLLLHGVDRELMRRAINQTHQTAFLPIENTSFLDWYFGLRRLFNEGSRPTITVLSMNFRQLISTGTNGENFARTLMDRRDFLRVVQASHLDNTTASAYFFASFSGWLGGRGGFRNWLLEQWLPGASNLVQYFAPTTLRPLPDNVVLDRALPNLKMVSELCASFGSTFVYVIPATRNTSDPIPALLSAAGAEGVHVIAPYPPGEMPANAFADGFHLNATGAKLFTERLAPLLLQINGGGSKGQRVDQRPRLGEKTGG